MVSRPRTPGGGIWEQGTAVTPGYIVRRILLFVLVVWMATSVIFFLPRLAPGRDPTGRRLGSPLTRCSMSSSRRSCRDDPPPAPLRVAARQGARQDRLASG